jgi:hypothetical protein
MTRLSMALTTELTAEHVAVFWDALCDLPITSVTFACQHAARHWRPTEQERYRFPLPVTLREYAQQYRERTRQAQQREDQRQLPQRTATTDEEGIRALRQILHKLGDHMEMTHPVYQAPSVENPDKRREELLEQVWKVMHPEAEEVEPYDVRGH